MKNIFNSVPVSVPKKNLFDLSHEVKTTFEMGQLVPFFCEPVIPGDRFRIKQANLIRFAPLLAPMMAKVDAYVHYFYVPNRLIWDNWEDFITQSHNGKRLPEEDLPLYPKITISPGDVNAKAGISSLYDYLGFPTVKGAKNPYTVDALPFRAYQRIWFDYYRDQNLSNEDEFTLSKYSGNLIKNATGQQHKDWNTHFQLRNRAWKKDYFTSALPFAQKGDDVLIPGQPTGVIVGSTNQVLAEAGIINDLGGTSWYKAEGGLPTSGDSLKAYFTRSDSGQVGTSTSNQVNPHVAIIPSDIAKQLSVETLGNPDESTIRDLRRAYAAQRFLERKALGGSRYIEQNLAFFGVRSSDARLQRAEFLGGMKQPIVISQVLQTSETTQESPLGQPAGNAVSAGSKYLFDRYFEEYGYVIGLISVIPKADYMQGMPRKYLKFDPYDYYWPQFAKIGEQAIQKQEVFFDPNDTSGVNQSTFGYTPRYAEYRFINNHIHGDFKDSLSFWTLARMFDSTQSLNEDFITCKPRTDVFAYENADFNHLWVQIGIDCKALRPITKYGEAY